MGRIEEGFGRRFRELLARVRPRRLDFGGDLLMGRARERARREGVAEVDALARLYEETRARVERRLQVMAACTVAPPAAPPPVAEPRFLCDGSLGGLEAEIQAKAYQALQAAGRAGLEMKHEEIFYVERWFEDYLSLLEIFVEDDQQRNDVRGRARGVTERLCANARINFQEYRYRSICRAMLFEKTVHQP